MKLFKKLFFSPMISSNKYVVKFQTIICLPAPLHLCGGVVTLCLYWRKINEVQNAAGTNEEHLIVQGVPHSHTKYKTEQ